MNLIKSQRLDGVNASLAAIVQRAVKAVPFDVIVVEGLRTKARQADLFAQGRTKPGKVVTWTLDSKHIEGRAVDLAPMKDGEIDWSDPKKFDAINTAMQAAAREANVKIRWGADWDMDGRPRERGESDSPHWELA
jgi:peptidoglycan L-alanyl-D-glutamate endopeptidase CwlK